MNLNEKVNELQVEVDQVISNTDLPNQEKLEKLDELLEYVERFKAGVVALREGKVWHDVYDEIFLERKDVHREISHKLGRMIEHLLKIAYCASKANYDRCKYRWIKDCIRPKREVRGILQWGRHVDKNLVKYCNDKLQNIYEFAIDEYTGACRKYADLKDGLTKIPEQCPWTLKQLMDDDIPELVSVLPDIYRTEVELIFT
jgi:hypothetical protein